MKYTVQYLYIFLSLAVDTKKRIQYLFDGFLFGIGER